MIRNDAFLDVVKVSSWLRQLRWPWVKSAELAIWNQWGWLCMCVRRMALV